MKRIFLLLLFLSLSFAGNAPDVVLLQQLEVFLTLLVPLMIVMVLLAAVVYIVGQSLGAETRAKATAWANGMLAAVGVSAVIIAMLYFLLPSVLTGGVPTGADADVPNLLSRLVALAEQALGWLIVTMLVLAGVVYALGQAFGAETRARATVWATGLLAGGIFAAILYVLIFQILTNLGTTLFAGTVLEQYGAVIINIAFFVSFLIIITYLLSKVFKVPEWEAYLNIELSNLMISFLVVFFVVGMFAAGDLVAISFGGQPTPPLAALRYMQDQVANSVLNGIFDIYQIQACTSIMSTISRRIGEFALTQTYKVFPGVDTFVSISNVVAFGLISVYGSIAAQIALLHLVDGTMVNFFLPAGLILRFFPPTRDAGAFLISLAFGFQIIFPGTYLIHMAVYEEIGGTPYDTPTIVKAMVCGPFKYGAYGILFNTKTNPVFSLFPFGTAIGNALQLLVSESLLNYLSMAEFVVILERLASLSLVAIFMPALSMMITIAFINTMTKFIVAKV